MKDVEICEKPREADNKQRSGDLRMGQPDLRVIHNWIHRLWKRTGRTETSKYPEEKKSTEIPQVAASERGVADQFCSSKMVWESQP